MKTIFSSTTDEHHLHAFPNHQPPASPPTMHLSALPTTLSLLLLTTTAAATPKPSPNPLAIDLRARHAPPGTSSFTGGSTLTGPAPTIETDSEPVLNHAAPLAETTAITNHPTVQLPTATSIVSNSILVADGRPIETLIPMYTGTPPLVVTDAAGAAVGTSSSKRPKATGKGGGDEGGTLLDISSSGSSSSGAKAVRLGKEGQSGLGLALGCLGVVVGIVVC